MLQPRTQTIRAKNHSSGDGFKGKPKDTNEAARGLDEESHRASASSVQRFALPDPLHGSLERVPLHDPMEGYVQPAASPGNIYIYTHVYIP